MSEEVSEHQVAYNMLRTAVRLSLIPKRIWPLEMKKYTDKYVQPHMKMKTKKVRTNARRSTKGHW